MLHAKASMEKGEYRLSIKYMLSFPDAVRLQVINFTFERFPITDACAPLITTRQHRTSRAHNAHSVERKPKEQMTDPGVNISICELLTPAQRQSNFLQLGYA